MYNLCADDLRRIRFTLLRLDDASQPPGRHYYNDFTTKETVSPLLIFNVTRLSAMLFPQRKERQVLGIIHVHITELLIETE